MKLLFLGLLLSTGLSLQSGKVEDFAATKLEQVTPGTITYRDDNGFLYSKNELDALKAGSLTEGKIAQVAKATKKTVADPAPAITDFDKQLKALGIRLIVLPVPPKMAVYPPAGLEIGEAAKNFSDYCDELRGQGIEIVDLTSDLIAAREQNVYCRQDSHWSPVGIEIAANKLASLIELRGDTKFDAKPENIKVVGDLMYSLDPKAAPSEELTINKVEGTVFDDASPILLLGDSHTLVFSSGGDMLAENAGLGEQLALKLSMPIDVIRVKGSASTPVRADLFRKSAKNKEWLGGKKVIIWCFTFREFTESANGWSKVPVKR